MRSRTKMRAAVLGMVAASALALAPAAGAQADAPSWRVVADDLNNPRQLVADGSDVLVAEAGTGGTNCRPGGPCIGFTGSVTKIGKGGATRIQTGLVSLAMQENGNTEVTGVDALAIADGDLFGIASGTCLPHANLRQLGRVLRLNGGTSVTSLGNPAALECDGPVDPDGTGRDTDPYGIAVRGDTAYVADAAGNDIVKVHDGRSSVLAVLPSTDGAPLGPGNQPVPTSLAWGPDGALYIGTLSFATLFGSGPGGAKVYRLNPTTGGLRVYARGFTAITGLTFDKAGRLYVSELTTGLDGPGLSAVGDVVVVPPGGGRAGRTVIGRGVLHFPGGVAVTDGGLYVSNWSVAPGTGPGPHGQVVRFDLDS